VGSAGLNVDHAALAALGREYLLAGHLIDRAGMPQVISRFGRDAMTAVAIEEWMGASPVYTARTRRALGFAGDDVAAVFKAMQLDIGAPHGFMDFRYAVTDAHHGEFHLASCGALMDVEPLGDEFVVAMCHHIEDPTFDATATATNPRARMRPVHRPPRSPADRHPHCRWTVEIDDDADPLPVPEAATRVGRSLAASVVLGADVAPSYDGPFDPEFRLEALPPAALDRALDEVCLQGHLLAHSFLLAIARRWGDGAAREVGFLQCAGVAGVVATRLARFLGVEGGGDGVADVLRLHPLLRPAGYVAAAITRDGEDVVLTLADAPALRERDGWSWPALLASDPPAGAAVIDALVQGVDPRARTELVGPLTWSVAVDPAATAAPEANAVTLTRFSTGADYVFRT
jgi:hypothetical protein